jgi:hypothetical protein
MVSRISLMQQMVRTLLDHLLNVPEASVQPGPNEPERTGWSTYTGSFLGARAGLALISVEDDHLALELNGQRLALQAHSATIYLGSWPGSENPMAVGFLPEIVGPVRYITIDEKPCERFERDPLFVPDPPSWVCYIGTYREDVLEETIIVQLANDQLLLCLHDNTANRREGVCIPISETQFTWREGLIEFQIAEDGTILGLTAMKVYQFRRL